MAYFSISPNDIEILQNEKSKSSDRIIKLKQSPRHLLASILISNNFINIAIVLLSDYLVGILLNDKTLFHWSVYLSDSIPFIGNNYATISLSIEFVITVVGVTSLLVLFGEVCPKIYANSFNLRLARLTSKPLIIVNKILYPISHQLVLWTQGMEKKMANRKMVRSSTSKEDIDAAIDLTIQRSNKAEAEISLLKRIVKFSDTSVKQIMTSRTDVTAIDITAPFNEIYNTVRDSGFSRIPVYSGDFDTIEGILYVKDLLQFMDDDNFIWSEIIRKEIMYVPETKRISELLKEFQSERKHLAIVVDEYGGSAGVVTLEDIMEEVVGDIKDEFDVELALDYKIIDKTTYEFDGKFLINDLSRVLNIDLDYFNLYKGESDSIAGMVLEVLGRMPKKNEELQFNEYKIKVISVNKKRIEKIQVSKNNA
ncbi:gliding motility-associated protein GldE [Membranihabitans marinus]